MSEQTDKTKKDQEEQKKCPEGQHMGPDGKCVPDEKKTTDSKDDPATIQLYKDSIEKLGYKVPKENCDSIASLKQLYTFAKANPKTDPKTDSDLPPELPPAADRDKKDSDEKKDSKEDIFKTKIDSIIGENVEAKDYTEEMDKKLEEHMDTLAEKLYDYSSDPMDVIEPSGDDAATSRPPQGQKSPQFDTKESKDKRKVDDMRAAEWRKETARRKKERKILRDKRNAERAAKSGGKT